MIIRAAAAANTLRFMDVPSLIKRPFKEENVQQEGTVNYLIRASYSFQSNVNS
jgi:hypothetical protein